MGCDDLKLRDRLFNPAALHRQRLVPFRSLRRIAPVHMLYSDSLRHPDEIMRTV